MNTTNESFGHLRFIEADYTAEEWPATGGALTICDEKNNDIASVYSDCDSTVDTTREQAIAYAHLFAAAPDMLALLQELIDIEGPQPGTSEWARKVNAAIAKATGELQ